MEQDGRCLSLRYEFLLSKVTRQAGPFCRGMAASLILYMGLDGLNLSWKPLIQIVKKLTYQRRYVG